jgi:hypothetical protein
VRGAQGDALPRASCSLQPSASMSEQECLALEREFDLAGIPVTADGAVVVHAIEPFGAGSGAADVARPARRCALRVRRLGLRGHHSIDWAAAVTVDLAAWMLASPPPAGSLLDVVVPAVPGHASPRLAGGLVDARHIWISAHDDAVEPAERDALRAWTRNAVEVMRSRWSAAGAACTCC